MQEFEMTVANERTCRGMWSVKFGVAVIIDGGSGPGAGGGAGRAVGPDVLGTPMGPAG